MPKYVVAKSGALSDETVHADHCRITEAGALEFTIRKPGGPAPGQRTHDVLVQAFAPGRWVEVLRVPEPTQDRCRCTDVCCAGRELHGTGPTAHSALLVDHP